jgi:hypothetical protein
MPAAWSARLTDRAFPDGILKRPAAVHLDRRAGRFHFHSVLDLTRLAASLSDEAETADLPVGEWHPSHCGEMDLVIRSDGSWWHEGSPMARPKLVRLFSRILRRDEDGYVLVTPAEKLTITVEDVPFLAVDYEREDDGSLVFRTNVGDRVPMSQEHPMTLRASAALGGQKALYLLVRGGLEARLDRPVYYRLAEEGLDEEARMLVIDGGENARFTFPVDGA